MRQKFKCGESILRVVVIAAVMLGSLALGLNDVPRADAAGSWDNARMADIALTYVGRWGGDACTDAGRNGGAGGQCKSFVNCITWMASSGTQWPAPGYQTGFANAGATEVTSATAVKGDVIQIGTSDTSSPLHTAIVVANLGGGTFDVVDSNYALNEIVSHHHYTPPSGARFWRLGAATPAEGSFIRATDNGEVYRVVGGAPLYVGSWGPFGGVQPVMDRTRAQINAMPVTPADGTFVAASGYVYRFAGGAPIYVSNWASVGGAQPAMVIDAGDIANAGGASPWNHVRRYPADGTFVNAAGYVFRFAGGAPIYVASWANVGGSQPSTTVDISALNNADGAEPWNHVRKYPADGTFVNAGGYIFRFAGGAPIYVASWANVGGSQPNTGIDINAIANADGATPWNHVRRYPADGTFVNAGGYIYRFAGGAPLYVSNWASVGGSQPNTGVDINALHNADGATPWNHVHRYPTDGTVLRLGPSGPYAQVRGGVPVSLPAAPAGPAPVVVDPSVVANGGGPVPWDHLRSALFAPINPAHVLDTRAGQTTVDGQFNNLGLRAAGSTTEVQITGRAQIEASAIAVFVDVRVHAPVGGGYVTVYPCGASRPNASTLNYASGQPAANGAVVKVGTGGKICLFTSQATHLSIDVNGMYQSSTLTVIAPARLYESRSGQATTDGQQNGTGLRGAGTTTEVIVGGRATVPAAAGSVVLNVTAVSPQASGYITVWPCGVTRPTASTVNLQAGRTIANGVTVKLGTAGKVCVYTSTNTHLIVDVSGHYTSTSTFVSVVPARLLETRAGQATVDGQQNGGGQVLAGSETQVGVAGRGGAPGAPLAAIVNIAAISPSASGYLTIWACGDPRPQPTLSYVAGQTVAINSTIKVGANGKVCVYSSAATHVIVDLSGYMR